MLDYIGDPDSYIMPNDNFVSADQCPLGERDVYLKPARSFVVDVVNFLPFPETGSRVYITW